MKSARWLGAVLAVAGLGAILGLTLFPNPQQAAVADLTPLLCLICGEAGGADVVRNLLLFMPMAAGLALLGWPWGRIVALCALVSVGVETLQHISLTGRDASLSDVLSNTAGGAAAVAAGLRLGPLLGPGPALARRLSLAAAAAWFGILLFTALSMRPWAPPGRLRNYCTASFPTSEIFAGTARSMTLNGVMLSCDRDLPHDGTAVKDELRRGEAELVTVAAAGAPSGGVRIIHVVRGPAAAAVMLAQRRRDALFQAPTAAQAFRLFPPVLRLSQAFPARAGAPVELVAQAGGRRLRLAAAHATERRSVGLPLSPSYGWTLLFAVGLEPGTSLRLAAALWLGALILPAAYWAGFAAPQVGTLGALGGTAIGGLGLLPPLTGFDPVHPSEWLGAGGGIALGWALSRIAAYLQSRCGSPSTSAYSSS